MCLKLPCVVTGAYDSLKLLGPMIIKNVSSENEAEQKHSKSYTNSRKHIEFVLKHTESEGGQPNSYCFSHFLNLSLCT